MKTIAIYLSQSSGDRKPVIVTPLGDTYAIKDQLKSMGFVFGHMPDSSLDGKTFNLPPKGWYKAVECENFADLKAAAKAAIKDLSSLGYKNLSQQFTPAEIEELKK